MFGVSSSSPVPSTVPPSFACSAKHGNPYISAAAPTKQSKLGQAEPAPEEHFGVISYSYRRLGRGTHPHLHSFHRGVSQARPRNCPRPAQAVLVRDSRRARTAVNVAVGLPPRRFEFSGCACDRRLLSPHRNAVPNQRPQPAGARGWGGGRRLACTVEQAVGHRVWSQRT